MTRAVSSLGDTALLLPSLAAFCLYLCALRRFGFARDAVLSLLLALGATLGSKLVFRACGHEIDSLDIASPSGHSAFATIGYGTLAYAFGAGRPRAVRVGLAIVAAFLVVAVGASRIVSGYHSAEEVVLGTAFGGAAMLFLLWRRQGAGDRPLSPVPPILGAACLVLILFGRSLTFEYEITRFARRMAATLDVCTVSAAGGPAILRP